MRSDKKKRLEAKGWKVGTTRDFLGLSSQEEAYIEIKLRLAESLRDQRQQRNMTQLEVAKVIKSSQSRVAKMEAGERSVSLDLLVRTLLAVGVSVDTLARLISPCGVGHTTKSIQKYEWMASSS
jgi:predicted XRE-type DNA-binding protein